MVRIGTFDRSSDSWIPESSVLVLLIGSAHRRPRHLSITIPFLQTISILKLSNSRKNDPMDLRDSELVLAAKDGDTGAFEELVRRHDRRLLQVSYGIMGNMQDAYDAYQDGILRAYLRLDSFRFESSFGTWVTRIVINQSLNLKKKLRWKHRLSLDGVLAAKEQHNSVEPSARPDELLIQTEISQEIRDSLDRLSDRERTVFVLKHQHGYKIREIARMIGCADGTVKNYLFRGTAKMRDSLEHLMEEPLRENTPRENTPRNRV